MLALAIGTVTAALAADPAPIIVKSGTATVQYSIAGGSSDTAAIVNPGYPTWSTIPGTNWINPSGLATCLDPACGTLGAPKTATYTTSFDLPAVSSASIQVEILADNSAVSIKLNGTTIGAQGDTLTPDPDPVNFTTVSTFNHATTSTFVAGTNTLSIQNKDYGVADGIDFKATVTYVPAPLVISFVTPTSKTYDANTDADITSCSVAPAAAGLTCAPVTGAHAGFDNKNVGTAKSVSADVSDFTLSGPLLAEYTNRTVATTSADITSRDLTVSATGVDRDYDGTDVATVSLSNDALSGDTVTNAYGAATFTTGKNVGTNKAVSVTGISISGADAGNYNLTNTTASTTANIAKRPITVTATYNIKTADGPTTSPVNDGLSASALPAISPLTPLATGDTAVGLIEKYLDPTANVGKTLRPFGTANDGNSGDNYAYTFVDVTTGQIRPAAVASIVFTTQPIDTQVSTPIYSFCAPPASGTLPCATAPTSAPIKVTARDAFGNLAGPGSPGADGTTAAVIITIKETGQAPTLGTASTFNGLASFGDSLVIGATRASTSLAASTIPSGTATSTSFQVVSDLAACDGQICDNLAKGGATGLSQTSFGRIKTSSDFFVPGTSQNVILTTQFSSFDRGRCASPAKTVGQTSEVRVQGTGVSPTSPAFSVTLIYPKDTIKALGLTARSADKFEVCLGATWLGMGDPIPWKAKNLSTGALQNAVPESAGSKVYWGWVPMCEKLTSTQRLTNPCIKERTKEEHELREELVLKQGIPLADYLTLGMKDADVAIVISKPWPWDGKFGTGLK